MKKPLLLLLLIGIGIAKSSGAVETSLQPNSTVTNINANRNPHVSRNEEIRRAISNLSAHAKQKEKELAELTKPLELDQLLRLANQGNPIAQYNLGVKYTNGEGVRQDYNQARQWYEKAANQGNSKSQHNLGVMYDNGESVRQDYNQARQWYEKAANQGNSRSQHNLGVMYYKGEGVRQNMAIAKEWFGKSCDNGNQTGCVTYRKLNMQGY